MIKSHLLYQLSYRGRAAGILLSECPGIKRWNGVDWKSGVRHDSGWNPQGRSGKSVEVAAALRQVSGIGIQARSASE